VDPLYVPLMLLGPFPVLGAVCGTAATSRTYGFPARDVPGRAGCHRCGSDLRVSPSAASCWQPCFNPAVTQGISQNAPESVARVVAFDQT
jgi:hypothetical protein